MNAARMTTDLISEIFPFHAPLLQHSKTVLYLAGSSAASGQRPSQGLDLMSGHVIKTRHWRMVGVTS
jgi:hypothetical protein